MSLFINSQAAYRSTEQGRRPFVIWLLAGLISIAFTVLMFFPAAWMMLLVERVSEGRFTLGDAQGTLWRGSAFIGAARGKDDPVTPIVPGRFSWQLSPMLLLGVVDARLENADALSQPVSVTGNWHQWSVSPATMLLPAERLVALGAPLNTLRPSGQLKLAWQSLQFTGQNGEVGLDGKMNLEIDDLSSRMSFVKPLGCYNLALDWHGNQAAIKLASTKGPMLLSGSGLFKNGHLQFEGTARAEAGQEKKLANFLNLLGQHGNEKDVIVLEFK